MCRRAHGAGFVTWVGSASERFELLSGEADLRRYQSSELATRSFCGRCGTMLFFESSRWPGEIHVVRANIPGEIDRAAEGHVHTDTRVDWLDHSV